MREDFENCEHTDVSNTYLLSKGIVVYVRVGGWPMTYTTSMAGAGRPGTGGSITTSFDVLAGDATLMDMKNGHNETTA